MLLSLVLLRFQLLIRILLWKPIPCRRRGHQASLQRRLVQSLPAGGALVLLVKWPPSFRQRERSSVTRPVLVWGSFFFERFHRAKLNELPHAARSRAGYCDKS